jgi:hypothetical protein
MKVPGELYALGLAMLMDQQDVHHFEIDLTTLDPEKSRGLSIDFEITDEKIVVSTGRCPCSKCATVGQS